MGTHISMNCGYRKMINNYGGIPIWLYYKYNGGLYIIQKKSNLDIHIRDIYLIGINKLKGHKGFMKNFYIMKYCLVQYIIVLKYWVKDSFTIIYCIKSDSDKYRIWYCFKVLCITIHYGIEYENILLILLLLLLLL